MTEHEFEEPPYPKLERRKSKSKTKSNSRQTTTDFTKYKKCFGHCLIIVDVNGEVKLLGECANCRLRGLCKSKSSMF